MYQLGFFDGEVRSNKSWRHSSSINEQWNICLLHSKIRFTLCRILVQQGKRVIDSEEMEDFVAYIPQILHHR